LPEALLTAAEPGQVDRLTHDGSEGKNAKINRKMMKNMSKISETTTVNAKKQVKHTTSNDVSWFIAIFI